MKQRKHLMAASAAAALMGLGTAAQAVPAVVAVEVAPPAPIVQTIPAPRAGYVWQEARWVQHPDGSWTTVGGHWVPADATVALNIGRDRDRDGIADHLDDDKDNDGTPNRYDSHPNNRWRD